MIVYVNGEQREFDDDATLIEALDHALDRAGELPGGVAVALDGAVVPRRQIAETLLSPDARVEIVTAVQGG